MSMSPRQVDKLSLWEMNAAIAGYISANGGDVAESLSDAEVEELGAFIDRA